jgi:cytidyltransferase-like protein
MAGVDFQKVFKTSSFILYMKNKVFVSGCFDLLHSGHVRFFEEASQFGELYVAIGSDKTVRELKERETINTEAERLYIVNAIKFVKKAFISSGSGMLDFEPELRKIVPSIFVVNEDGDKIEKRRLCEELGIKYYVLKRTPKDGLPMRSTTLLRKQNLIKKEI